MGVHRELPQSLNKPMRFERKYRIENEPLAEVLQLLRLNPAAFRMLYPERQINNIYFDTHDLMTFRQNLAGQNERRKFRVRWYGDDPRVVENPRFEIKRKHNELGDKIVRNIAAFSFGELDQLSQAIRDLPLDLPSLRPVLLNSYRRAYFQSADQHFRVTVDYDMRYHSMIYGPAFDRYLYYDPALIVELKYERELDRRVNFITQHLPYRQARHSKYITGVQLTN